MAAAGPRPLQSGPVDLHTGARPDAPLLLPSHRVPQRHADLLEREARLHRVTDGPHAQVLLLGCEPSKQKRHHTKGTRYVLAYISCIASAKATSALPRQM